MTEQFKAVQMGGPSGGCIPAQLIDTPVTYEDINKTGAIVGSGGMIVMDEDTCMVDMARYFLNFTRDESCGKCNYCRIGTKRMLEILERITEGEGKDGDIELLEELAMQDKGRLYVRSRTDCAKSCTDYAESISEMNTKIISTTRNVLQHPAKHSSTFHDHRCMQGLHVMLARNCPVGAISGSVKEKHVIDQDKCIKCGKCLRNMQVRSHREEIREEERKMEQVQT